MNRHLKIFLILISDICVTLLSVTVAYLLRFEGQNPSVYIETIHLTYVFYILTSILTNTLLQCYMIAFKYPGLPEMLKLGVSTICTGIIIYIFNYLNILQTTTGIIIIASILQFMLMSFVRFSGRLIRWFDYSINISKKSINCKRVLIIGGGYAGATLISKLIANPKEELRPVVVVDDNPSLKGTLINGIKVMGDRRDIPRLVRKYGIDEIILAIPSANKLIIRELYSICKMTKCRIRRFVNIMDIESSIVHDGRTLVDFNIEDLLSRDEIHLNHTEVAKYINGRKVLVTGAAGSIGSEICKQVLSYGCGLLIALSSVFENVP